MCDGDTVGGRKRRIICHNFLCVNMCACFAMQELVTNSPVCVCGSSKLLCVCVLFGMIERVWRPCQGCGYSPARGRGRGAQILHYGLIHHPRDSLAPLSALPPSPPISPSNLSPLYLQLHKSLAQHLLYLFHLISLPQCTVPLRLLLFFPPARYFPRALLLACLAPVFPPLSLYLPFLSFTLYPLSLF